MQRQHPFGSLAVPLHKAQYCTFKHLLLNPRTYRRTHTPPPPLWYKGGGGGGVDGIPPWIELTSREPIYRLISNFNFVIFACLHVSCLWLSDLLCIRSLGLLLGITNASDTRGRVTNLKNGCAVCQWLSLWSCGNIITKNGVVYLVSSISLNMIVFFIDETLVTVTADHSHVFTIGTYAKRGNPIFGIVQYLNGKIDVDLDNKTYTSIGYHNGPGGLKGPRQDLRGVDTADKSYFQQATVLRSYETHGSEDIGKRKSFSPCPFFLIQLTRRLADTSLLRTPR